MNGLNYVTMFKVGKTVDTSVAYNTLYRECRK